MGSTSILVEDFVRGPTEADHECDILDICHVFIGRAEDELRIVI